MKKNIVFSIIFVMAFILAVTAVGFASTYQGGLLAEYYGDKDLNSLKLIRVDPRINFEWKGYSPDASIGVDNFSVRWQGQIKIDVTQDYTFYAMTDDGCRLWIDDKLIMDRWYDQGVENQVVINLTAGFHNIKCEYYENGGWASTKLFWSAPSIIKTVIPADHLYYFSERPEGPYCQGGLKGIYSKFIDLCGFPLYVFTRIDPQINFDWGDSSADSFLGEDNYLVKWKGKIKIDQADNYNFYTTTDDGARLWIDTRLIIDAWQDQSATEIQGSVYLTPGLYDIELNYYDRVGFAVCKLYWSSGSIPKSVIPPANLYYQTEDFSNGGLFGGLLAEYYDNSDVSVLKLRRVDSGIDFDWASTAPDNYIESDTYSIRWVGQVKADYNEVYTFYATADDGLRFSVDGIAVIDTLSVYCPYEQSGAISLTQGWHCMKIEYRENTGWAAVKLAYSSPSTPKMIIPRNKLNPCTLSGNDVFLTLYSRLGSEKEITEPVMGHSGALVRGQSAGAAFVPCRNGNGVLLNGTVFADLRLVKFSSADLNPKEGMIEFWLKPNWNSNDGRIHKLLVTDWSWDGCIEILKYSDNTLHWKIVKDGTQYAIVSDASSKWNAGNWCHLAFSYGPQGMKFYLNYKEMPIQGTFYGEEPYKGSLPEIFSSDLYLGGSVSGGESSNAVFDEIKIYGKQLIPTKTVFPPIVLF
ncbi:MAG: PA14 domain-containing protein [Candidatus Omnitrophota bacterium]